MNIQVKMNTGGQAQLGMRAGRNKRARTSRTSANVSKASADGLNECRCIKNASRWMEMSANESKTSPDELNERKPAVTTTNKQRDKQRYMQTSRGEHSADISRNKQEQNTNQCRWALTTVGGCKEVQAGVMSVNGHKQVQVGWREQVRTNVCK